MLPISFSESWIPRGDKQHSHLHEDHEEEGNKGRLHNSCESPVAAMCLERKEERGAAGRVWFIRSCMGCGGDRSDVPARWGRTKGRHGGLHHGEFRAKLGWQVKCRVVLRKRRSVDLVGAFPIRRRKVLDSHLAEGSVSVV